MMQPVLQVGEFFQRHVQKAIKLAQHLLGPLPKRNPLRRQSDNHATFVARRPLPRDESLALNALEHRGEGPEFHPQQRGEVAHALRPTLPKHDESQILGIGHTELLQEGYEQARHVIAGGVEREAKMAVEPWYFHRRNRASNIQASSFYIVSHIIDSYYIVCKLIVSSITVNGCLRGHDQHRHRSGRRSSHKLKGRKSPCLIWTAVLS